MKKRTRRAQGDEGFGLIEVAVALSVLMLVMLGFQAMITATFQTYSQARNTTLGQQVASDKLEQARRWKWDDLGTVNGSPRGTILDDTTVQVGYITFSVHTVIKDVLDASGNYMNLRRVEVTTNRIGTNLLPVTLATIIASPTAGSVGKGTILVTANDFCTTAQATPIPNLMLGIDKGPSGAISQTTDQNGVAQFTQLTPTAVANPPTPAGVPQDYYALTFTDATSPYALARNSGLDQRWVNSDAPASWNTKAQLALEPGTKIPKVLLFYREGSLKAHILATNPDGSAGPETDVPGSVVFTNTDMGITYDSQVVVATPHETATVTKASPAPAVTDTINPCEGSFWSFVFTPSGQTALPVTSMAQGGAYPADLVVDGTVALPKPIAQSIRLLYNDNLTPVVGATVRLSGGGPKPTPAAAPITAVTDATGTAAFNVQWNSAAYQVSVAAGPPTATAPTGWAALAPQNLTVNATPAAATQTYQLARPATVGQQIKVVNTAGTAAVGATVTVTGGSTALTAVTDAAGIATISPIQPSSVAYNVAVAALPPNAANPNGVTAGTGTVTVDPTPTLTTITVPAPVPVAVQFTVIFPGGVGVRNAWVTVGTGPSAVTGQTDNSGQLTLLVMPSVAPYSVTIPGGTSGGGNPTGWLPVADTVTVNSATTKSITVVAA